MLWCRLQLGCSVQKQARLGFETSHLIGRVNAVLQHRSQTCALQRHFNFLAWPIRGNAKRHFQRLQQGQCAGQCVEAGLHANQGGSPYARREFRFKISVAVGQHAGDFVGNLGHANATEKQIAFRAGNAGALGVGQFAEDVESQFFTVDQRAIGVKNNGL